MLWNEAFTLPSPSKPEIRHLHGLAASLFQASIKPSTNAAYHHHWVQFQLFRTHTLQRHRREPIQVYDLILFATHLHSSGKKYATILNYLSAISFHSKLRHMPDLISSFHVQKFLLGIKNSSHPSQPLQPVSLVILSSLVNVATHAPLSHYYRALMCAVMSLMYFACLRIGEVAVSSHAHHMLSCSQVSVSLATPRIPSISIRFHSFKHSKGKTPTLRIQHQPGQPHCPVATLSHYLSIRPGPRSGPLFLLHDASPLTRPIFLRYLRQLLAATPYCNLNINTHSFRVGRTTDMATSGKYSDIYIQKVGRWSSSAYKQYIRPLVICPQ